MSSNDTLDIGYCNVRGLNDLCFNALVSYLHSSRYQLFLASETWFLNRTRYLSHSFFLAESTYPQHPHINRRQDGGLILLASPEISKKIFILHISTYIIKIKILTTNQTIAFVYFPPSLSDTQLITELNALGQVDAIIGDLNVRLGILSGDNITNASSRRKVLYNYFSQNHLRYIRNANSTVISRTDHIYNNSLKISWSYDAPVFKTDHQIMSLLLETPNLRKSPSLLGTKRYNLNTLSHPIFNQEFLSIYEKEFSIYLLKICESTLSKCCHSMILPSTSETQLLIDACYEFFLDTITELLDKTLVSYDANSVKHHPDKLLLSNNDPISHEKIIRSYKRSQRSINANNPITSSDPTKTPLEECHSYYQNQFSSDEQCPQIHRQNDIEFSLRFKNDIIARKIKRYSSTKSIGPDNIHTIVYKILIQSEYFQQTLSALFQTFAATSLVPSNWSNCNLHLLKKDLTNPIADNTRPIALSNFPRRIFESITLQFWTDDNETWTHLNYGQAGFRRGYSTFSHLILSDELSRRDSPISIFLDIKGAFDNISWLKLKQILVNRHCSDTHLNLILSLICKPASLFLTVNHSEQTTITTQKGVFQGGGISAFIFTLYIDPLAESLNITSLPYRPLALLFADDVQLKVKSEFEAQKALNICSRYGREYNMRWSLKKCAIVSNTPRLLLLDDQPLPNSKEYKYLGFLHKWNGLDLKNTYNTQVNRQQNLLTALSDQFWHPKAKLTIYRTFIRPLTEYSGLLTYIWALKNHCTETLKTMKHQHHAALKWIFNRNQYFEALDYLSGLGPWNYRLECLRSSLSRSLSLLHTTNPLRAAKKLFQISSNSRFILQECYKSEYLTDFLKQFRPTLPKPSHWKTWKTKKLQSLLSTAATKSALLSYLGTYDPYTIKIFFNLPSDKFYKIMSWRLNRSFLHCICTCSSTFNRSHIDCVLKDHELYETYQESPDFYSSLQKISSHQAPHYCVLDYLLNRYKFTDFFLLLAILQANLHRN